MTWRKAARLVIAVVGLSCAGAVYFLLGKRQPPITHIETPPAGDPGATNETGPGKLRWLHNGQEEWQVQYDSSSSYADGHMRLGKAHFQTAHGSEPFELWANSAVVHKPTSGGEGPGNVELTGHVVVETAGKWHMETDTATYSEQTSLLTMPGAVTFSHDLTTGDSRGATYDRKQLILVLLADPHVTMKPDASGTGALNASADQMTINRSARFARLDQHARIVRDQETLAGDLATLALAEDEKTVRSTELHGHASVVPQPGAANPPPEMHADDITLGMRPDGKTLQNGTLRRGASLAVANANGIRRLEGQAIDFGLAPDGQTLTALSGTEGVSLRIPPSADTPARTIASQKMSSVGDDKSGLRELHFDGAGNFVTFTEASSATKGAPSSTRTGVSRTMTLKLNGDLGSMESAEFLKNVTFTKDAGVTATAERAVYFEAKPDAPARLFLYSVEGGKTQPRVVNGDITIDGQSITIDVDTSDVSAKGQVKTVRKPPKNAPAKSTLFASDQPLLGFAAEVSYKDATHETTYVSSPGVRARVKQEDGANSVVADRIVVNSDTNNLSATGAVDSRFVSDSAPGTSAGGRGGAPTASPPKTYTVRGASMTYVDAKRIATYTGKPDRPAEIESADGFTSGQTLILLLDEDGRTLKQLTADGKIYTKSSTREATGEHLVWFAASGAKSDRYVMSGSPVIVKEPKTNPPPGAPGCSWSSYPSAIEFSSGGELHTLSNSPILVGHWDDQCSIKLPGGPGGS